MEAAVCKRREPKCITPCFCPGISQPCRPACTTAQHKVRGRMRIMAHHHAKVESYCCRARAQARAPANTHVRGTTVPAYPRASLETCTGKQQPLPACLPQSQCQNRHSKQRRGSFPLPLVPSRSHLGHQQWLVKSRWAADYVWGKRQTRWPSLPACTPISALRSLGEQHVLPCAVLQERRAAWKSFADHGGSSELPHAVSAIPHGRLCANSAGASGHRCHHTSH